MVKKKSFICPYCGGVILDDDQKYCDWCGSDLEEKKSAKSSSSGSCLGSIGTLLFVLLVIILLLFKVKQ